MVATPPIDEIHFSMEPDVDTVPGPRTEQLLARQRDRQQRRRLPASHTDCDRGGQRCNHQGRRREHIPRLFAGIGVLNVGHSNPYVLEGVHEQLDKVTHTVDFPTEARIEFIERLNDIAPDGLSGNSKVIFGGPSGSDAIEGSIKLAKHNTGRHGLLAFEGSYHGTTAGALSLTAGKAYKEGTGRCWPTPSTSRFRTLPSRDQPAMSSRSAPPKPVAKTVPVRVRWTRATEVREPVWRTRITRRNLGRADQGEGGVVVPPEGFLKGLRDIADDNDALLIFDEIQTGFGRTGEWFAAEHWDVTPDAMTMAKGIGGSGLPIGAMMYHEQYDTWGRAVTSARSAGTSPRSSAGPAQSSILNHITSSTTRQKSGRTSGRGSVNWPKRYPKSSTSVEKDNSRALSSK